MILPGDAAPLKVLRKNARRLLAVFPHPDDESYGPAGTLARTAADPDGAAVVLCLTNGEASQIGPERGLAPDEVAALRRERMVDVARILGLQGLLMPGLPDAQMARCALDELARPIAEVLDAFLPQVVIGHDPRGVNAHPDHIATHWALRHALLGRDVRLAMLAYPPEVAELVKPRLLFATPEEEVDVVVHLDAEETAKKEACLRVHEAMVTLVDHEDKTLFRRPPIERYDLLGEDFSPPLTSLF